eukprot:scaffold87928_cov75-Phaeocystis_antarctica.AAC.1
MARSRRAPTRRGAPGAARSCSTFESAAASSAGHSQRASTAKHWSALPRALAGSRSCCAAGPRSMPMRSALSCCRSAGGSGQCSVSAASQSDSTNQRSASLAPSWSSASRYEAHAAGRARSAMICACSSRRRGAGVLGENSSFSAASMLGLRRAPVATSAARSVRRERAHCRALLSDVA